MPAARGRSPVADARLRGVDTLGDDEERIRIGHRSELRGLLATGRTRDIAAVGPLSTTRRKARRPRSFGIRSVAVARPAAARRRGVRASPG